MRSLAPALAVLAVAAVGGVGLVGCGSESRELLPDLDQAAPDELSISGRGSRLLLVFRSAVDNVGDGPIALTGERANGDDAMTVAQVIERSDGSTETVATDEIMLYEQTRFHEHWHLQGFEVYELREAGDFSLVGPSEKTGFCLGDRYETSGLDLPGEPGSPQYDGNCGFDEPELASIEVGISVGYGDDYVPALEGQFVDVTRVPPGRYVLVHRVNPNRGLREEDYENNAASVLIELTPERSVTVLAMCPDSERCS